MISSIFCLPNSSLPFRSSSSMCRTRAIPRWGDFSKCWHTRFKYSNATISLSNQTDIIRQLIWLEFSQNDTFAHVFMHVFVCTFPLKSSQLKYKQICFSFYLSSDMSSFTMFRLNSRETSDSSISLIPENTFHFCWLNYCCWFRVYTFLFFL